VFSSSLVPNSLTFLEYRDDPVTTALLKQRIVPLVAAGYAPGKPRNHLAKAALLNERLIEPGTTPFLLNAWEEL